MRFDGVQATGNVAPKDYEKIKKEGDEKPQEYQNLPMNGGKADDIGDQPKFKKAQKIENNSATMDYSNFGGKDKATMAASISREAIDTVNDALKNFQKNFPGQQVDIDAFPNPTEYSKKTFGKDGAFTQWREAVSEWRNN